MNWIGAISVAAIGAAVGLSAAPADEIHGASAAHVDYAALDKLPDWRGIWTPKLGPPGAGVEKPDLKGKYLKSYQLYQASGGAKGGPAKISNCDVPGMPSIMMMPYDIEFLFTPGRVTIIQEAYMQVRRIYTDGRALPDDPDPTYNGSSIGHWEGDTLVIETVGLKDTTSLTQGVGHSDALTITERIHLMPGNPDNLVDEVTLTDKKALKKPWHETFSYERHREFDQLEYVCSENDRNPIVDGKTQIILQPDSP